MTAGKAAKIIHIMCDRKNRDPRFLEYIASKITRGRS